MDNIKQQYSNSVMGYITLSLISIIIVTLLTIFISFWITELADKDAQAINMSGSMRMKTYQIGLALKSTQPELANSYIEALDQTWNHSLFANQRSEDGGSSDQLKEQFELAYNHWSETLKPLLLEAANSTATQNNIHLDLLNKQVALTDDVVSLFQLEAERKIKQLRSFQLLALLATICVGALIYYLLKNRVEQPLSELMQTVDRFGKGDFSQRAQINEKDELGMMGAVFNQMSDSIEESYNQLEQRVNKRTEELHRNNTTLEFLFATAQKIIDMQQHKIDYQSILNDLSKVLNVEPLELCLFTPHGKHPYLHIAPSDHKISNCEKSDCDACKGSAPFVRLDTSSFTEHYPINRNDSDYGTINLKRAPLQLLEPWQEKLLRTTADQLAIALSLGEQSHQERRLAMLNERTVIARELHDSLAQALSYLQIQVSRLKRMHDMEKFELQPPVIDELREGLSSAYRQLRELLTTFRLKIDAEGLQGAMSSTVEQLLDRSNMQVDLDYQLSDLPLSSTEEIHLLQIMREASQNAIHHSQGSEVVVKLCQLSDQRIELSIRDNGVGIQQSPEKLNHYGLAIMNERGRHLGGSVEIKSHPNGGTLVTFSFLPEYLREQEKEKFKYDI